MARSPLLLPLIWFAVTGGIVFVHPGAGLAADPPTPDPALIVVAPPAPAVLTPPTSPAIVAAPVLVPTPLNSAGPDGWAPPPADDRFVIKLRPGRASIQTGMGLVGGTIWYWRNLNFNSRDWDLKWDGASWHRKLLGLDTVRFDTNDFVTNARDHTRVGGIYYLVARANGMDMKTSLAFGFGSSLVWEYVVEFKELVSLNDMIVTTMAGPAIGEPLLQVGRFFRRGKPTLVNRVLAFVFSPFEWLTGSLDKRPWQGDDTTDDLGFTIERGHRFQATVGGRAASFDGGTSRGDVTLALDMEVMMQRGYGHPGRWAGWIKAGDFSRMAIAFTFGDNADRMGGMFRTQTTVVGHYRQQILPEDVSGGGVRGYSLLLGAGTRFDFETRRLASEDDRVAVVNLFGPQLDWTVYAGDIVFRWEAAAYGDFAMVDSHAIGPETPPNPTPPLTGVLRAQGYYYAAGVTGITRARLDLWALSVEAELRAHHFASIDGPNRVDSPLDADFKNLTDDRLIGLGTLTLRPWGRGAGVAAYIESVGRRGTHEGVGRSSHEFSVGARLLLAL